MTDIDKASAFGADAGRSAASWVFDGNSTLEYAASVLRGVEDGDPEVLDMQPAPLSGEWAGESIPELSEAFGIDLSDDDIASAFENAYNDAYWAEVEKSAREILS